ncbi:hypothetical protein M1B72_09950 [Geomonas paludis]|uniref:Uncharacterized protein n=1 Tax=Geomonas paludis TaxID=2740185 RepID=A0A6V8MTH7_9BACT|nr:hypothetical protein [Geomonas paludis]UPU38009.1 hypothetical protein M1B72_09950 [Geomonas paludis]GFO63466.1 hypothetical protein GMPD_13850 [Geomonas paludis]
MKKHGHQFRHANPTAELDRKHQGSIGGQHLAKAASIPDEEKVSSMRSSISEDFTPGRDPAEGPDVALTAPVHERWAQHTAERDPTEGAALTATPPPRVRR